MLPALLDAESLLRGESRKPTSAREIASRRRGKRSNELTDARRTKVYSSKDGAQDIAYDIRDSAGALYLAALVLLGDVVSLGGAP